jgi:hypothetical protein
MAEKGDVYTPLNRRDGKIRPHAVTMEHLNLGSESLQGGDLQGAVFLTEISAPRANSRAVLKPGTVMGQPKVVKVAAGSKSVAFHPAGGERIVMAPEDAWFGVWNGAVWLTVFCSVKAPDDPVPKPVEPA